MVPGLAVDLADPANPTPLTVPAPTKNVDGTWSTSVVLPRLGVYTLFWSDESGGWTADQAECIGGPIVTIRAVRIFDSALADTAKYPAGLIETVRTACEREFSRITYRSFVPRGATVTVPGTDDSWFGLPDVDLLRLTAVSIDGQPVTDLSGYKIRRSDLVETPSVIRSDSAVTCSYEYGFPIVPEDVRQAALLRIRDRLLSRNSAIPDRATSFTPAEGGVYSLATAGRSGWETGIPDVDSVLFRYRLLVRNAAQGLM